MNSNIFTGAVLDASTTVNTATLQNQRTGSLANKGPATVYLQWSADTVTPDTTAANGKTYLDMGDSVRIPGGVKSFAFATASGSAKLLFVEA